MKSARFFPLSVKSINPIKISTHYQIIGLYSEDIFVASRLFNIILEYVKPQHYQSMSYYYHLNSKLSSDLPLIYTNQEYFVNKYLYFEFKFNLVILVHFKISQRMWQN